MGFALRVIFGIHSIGQLGWFHYRIMRRNAPCQKRGGPPSLGHSVSTFESPLGLQFWVQGGPVSRGAQGGPPSIGHSVSTVGFHCWAPLLGPWRPPSLGHSVSTFELHAWTPLLDPGWPSEPWTQCVHFWASRLGSTLERPAKPFWSDKPFVQPSSCTIKAASSPSPPPTSSTRGGGRAGASDQSQA